MPETKNLHVSVVTPAKPVYDGAAKAVVAPAFDGEVGVLPGHASFLALLGTGVVRVTTPDGKLRSLAVRGGFLQVHQDRVTVLTQESVASEEVAPDALQTEMDRLAEEKPTKFEEREALDARRAWVKARQRAGQRRN